MSNKGMKRLDLWLPENHPVFEYPPGARAKVAREWLDIGARLSGVERKLEELKDRLDNSISPGGQKKQDEKGLPFDPAAFARTLSNIFD